MRIAQAPGGEGGMCPVASDANGGGILESFELSSVIVFNE